MQEGKNFFSVREHVLDSLSFSHTHSHTEKNIPGKIYFPIDDKNIARDYVEQSEDDGGWGLIWKSQCIDGMNSICYMLFSIHPRLFSHQHLAHPAEEKNSIPFENDGKFIYRICEDTERALGINWFSLGNFKSADKIEILFVQQF